MKNLIRSSAFLIVLILALAPKESNGQHYVVAPPKHVGVVRPPMPKAGYIWTPDEWRWVNGRYIWVAGRWMRPPYSGAVWLPGSWRKTPKGYYWVAGKWGHRF